MSNAMKKKAGCKALEKPPQDRMVRRPASTREVLGRDPKRSVVAVGNGKLVHLHD